MRCEEVTKLIADYSADNLSRRTHSRVKEHIETCSDCAVELTRITAVMTAVESVQPLEPPAGLWNGVLNRILSEAPKKRTPALFPWSRRTTVSVTAATIIAAGVLYIGIGIQKDENLIEATDPSQIEYVQGHISAAAFDPMADRINIGIISSLQIKRGNDGQ